MLSCYLRWQKVIKINLLGHSKEIPLYIFRHTSEVSLISVEIKSLEHAPPIDKVLNFFFHVGFIYLFDIPYSDSPQAAIGVVYVEDEPQSKKRKRKVRPKKEEPKPLNPLTASPMFLDEESNAAVAIY